MKTTCHESNSIYNMKKCPNELRVKGVKKSILRKTKMLYIVESVNENWINSQKENESKAENLKIKISKLITLIR